MNGVFLRSVRFAVFLWILGCAGTILAAPAQIGDSVYNLKATSLSDSTIKLTWKVGSAAVTQLEIYRKTGAGKFELLDAVSATETAFMDTTATGNIASTPYSYYIKTFTDSVCIDKTTAAVVPFKPTKLAAEKAAGAINLAWNDNSSNEKRFEVLRKEGPGPWTLLIRTPAETATYSDTTVVAGHAYSYKVRAVHRAGAPAAFGYSAYSNIALQGDTSTLAGTVFSAQVAGGRVTARDGTGGVIAGPVTTNPDGSFSINVPVNNLSSDLMIESSGGTFIDEATGLSTTAGTLGAYLPAGSLSPGVSVNLDPSSTIIYHLVKQQGKTLSDAIQIFTSAFGYAPDTSVAPKNESSSGSDIPQRLAGLRAVAFSQLTYNLGLDPENQFDLLQAGALDLADGALDGMNGAAQVFILPGVEMPQDIQNRFELALTGLLSEPDVNKTGLTPNQVGILPFSKVALTDTYRIEYVPGMMAATAGKTSFKIVITNRSDGSPATGLAVSLMPLMHMSSMSHSSPFDAVVEDVSNPGTYKCSVYYLMASVMSDGTSMGFWELKTLIGGMMGESATFFPKVGMSMGTTTVRATLKGQSDTIAGMMGPEKRSYYLFLDSVTTTSFKLFLSAKESMMSYPAVATGTGLHDASGTEWFADPVAVSVSTDGSTWTDAAELGGGHWSVSGLTGLSSGVTGTVFVKVMINGEQKTTDGTPVTGSNGYASFTVTP